MTHILLTLTTHPLMIHPVPSPHPLITHPLITHPSMTHPSFFQCRYLFFCFLWTMNFIAGIGTLVIAVSVARWYFTTPDERAKVTPFIATLAITLSPPLVIAFSHLTICIKYPFTICTFSCITYISLLSPLIYIPFHPYMTSTGR